MVAELMMVAELGGLAASAFSSEVGSSKWAWHACDWWEVVAWEEVAWVAWGAWEAWERLPPALRRHPIERPVHPHLQRRCRPGSSGPAWWGAWGVAGELAEAVHTARATERALSPRHDS